MRIIGVDLHIRQQTIAMLDTETGELVEKTLEHDGDEVRKFYSALTGPVQVGLEASGSMHWFLELLEELGIDCRVGHPSEIRKAEARKQKHDRRDAALLLETAGRKALSLDLDAFQRTAGSAHTAAAPSSVGAYPDASAEHAASHGAQSRSAARQEAVEPSRPTRHCILAATAAYRLSAQRFARLV